MRIYQKIILSTATLSLLISPVFAIPALAQSDTQNNTVIQLPSQLGFGSRGDLVRLLQTFLASDPNVLDSKYITGYFGPMTKSAVQKFQKKNGLASVGRVGPKTLEKVNELLSTIPVSTTEVSSGVSCVKIPPGHLIAPGYLKKLGGVPTTKPDCQILPPGILKKTTGGWGGSSGGIDTTAPVISEIAVNSISTTTASLIFKTNEDTVFEVMYGPTTSYGMTSTKSTTFGKNHTFSFVGLTPNATYHYQIKSFDKASNPASSVDATFTTLVVPDITAPTISAITMGTITNTTTSISFTTNENATSKIYWSVTNPVVKATASNTSTVLGTSHTANISALTSGTTYYYLVEATDPSNNVTTSTGGTFTTTI